MNGGGKRINTIKDFIKDGNYDFVTLNELDGSIR